MRQRSCGERAALCKLACRTRMPQRTRHTCPHTHCCTRHSSGWRKPGTALTGERRGIASPLLSLQRRTRGSDARGIGSTTDRTHRRRNKCCRTRRMPQCLPPVRSLCRIVARVRRPPATHPHWWRTSRSTGKCCNRSTAPRRTFDTCRSNHPRAGNLRTWIRCNCRTRRAKRASPYASPYAWHGSQHQSLHSSHDTPTASAHSAQTSSPHLMHGMARWHRSQ